MAHTHNVTGAAINFILDENLNITAASDPVSLKQGDHKSRLKTFVMPRYFEGHDMSLCNKVEVHYNNINVNKSTRATTTNKSFDEVQNFGVLADDENKIGFNWLVQGDATELSGKLEFCIRFACMEEEVIEYQKFSGIFAGLVVDENIYNTEELTKVYKDVFEALLLEMEDKINNLPTDEHINELINEALGGIENGTY